MRFEDLEIWQESRELSKTIFALTNKKNIEIDYRFRSQIRASSGSIMDNIAEGFERDGKNEFRQFLSIAKGSCGELRSQLYRAYDYGLMTKSEFETLLNRASKLSKQISSFMKYLNKTTLKGSKFK